MENIPVVELSTGVITFLALVGVIILAALARPIPMVLTQILAGAIFIYFQSGSFNAGVEHGMKIQQSLTSNQHA